jgi:hypothetical protein
MSESTPSLIRVLRSFWFAIGGALLVLAAGYVAQAPWATGTWPWPDGRLSNIFVGSIIASVAVAFVWIGWSGELGALAAGAMAVVTIGLGSGGFLVSLGVAEGRPSLLTSGAVMLGLAVVSAGFFFWSRRISIRDRRPMPRFLRISFFIFIVALVFAASALVLKVPNVFPWSLKPESSVMYGWIFFGNAVNFLYPMLKPAWNNARAQLVSFLAYDLVLIPPFVAQYSTVKPEYALSLNLYLLVLIYSCAVAVYYLFLDPRTRSWRIDAPGALSRPTLSRIS